MSDIRDTRPKIGINWEYYSGRHTLLTAEQFKYESIYLSRIEFLSLLFPESAERRHLLERLNMTEKEELFAKFFSNAYNKGKDIDGMSFPELDAWITELEQIVFEAKASLQGASQAKREREANLKSSEREKLRNSDGTFNASDAINAVAKRKDRMSKRDKLEETYRNLGMSDSDIKELLGKIKVDEKSQESANKQLPLSGKTLDELAADKPQDESEPKPKSLVDKIVDSMLKAADKEPEKPFDATGLFG